MIRLLLPVLVTAAGFGCEATMTSTDKERFFQAAREGDIQTVQSMLGRDPSLVHISNERGLTPLMVAVSSMERNLQVVQILVQAGADVNAQTDDRVTALHMMVDVDGPAETGEVPSQLARVLVHAGANVEQRNRWGHTPLMSAVVGGTHHELQALIDVGANVNKLFPSQTYPTFNSGRTTLMAAVGDPMKVKLLLQAGASVSATDAHGQTAFEYARQCLTEAKEECSDAHETEPDRCDEVKTRILAELEDLGCDPDAPINGAGLTARQALDAYSQESLDAASDFDYVSQLRQSIRLIEEAMRCGSRENKGDSHRK